MGNTVADSGLKPALQSAEPSGMQPRRSAHAGLRVLVAGGSRGIGLAIAEGFAAAGARVSICARGEAGLQLASAQLRQHGGDASKLGRLGPGGLRAALAAVARLGEIIRTEHPGLPLIVLGHSWGSFLAQMLLNAHPDRYAGVILTGSALRWPGALNAGDLNAPWKRPGAHGMEWLSTDPDVWHAFRADPLTTEKPLRELFGIADAARLFGRPAKGLRERAGEVPLLLMVGADDTVGGPRSVHLLARAYRERSGYSDVTTLVYPGARHEIFNDVSWPQARADLLAWLGQRF